RCKETDPKKPPGCRHQPVAVSLSLPCFSLHLLAVRFGKPSGLHQLVDGLPELGLIILIAAVERIHASLIERHGVSELAAGGRRRPGEISCGRNIHPGTANTADTVAGLIQRHRAILEFDWICA